MVCTASVTGEAIKGADCAIVGALISAAAAIAAFTMGFIVLILFSVTLIVAHRKVGAALIASQTRIDTVLR